MNTPHYGPGNAGGSRVKPGWILFALLFVGLCIAVAVRDNSAGFRMVQTPAVSATSSWNGVWMRQAANGNGAELPLVELDLDPFRGPTGRMISAGTGRRDVALPLIDIQMTADDTLQFTTGLGAVRLTYRLVRSGPDQAILYSAEDVNHSLKTYLDDVSAASREKVQRQLASPAPPERIGTLVRVAAKGKSAGTPVSPPEVPTFPPQPTHPAGNAPANPLPSFTNKFKP
jgi:hypothetical protein